MIGAVMALLATLVDLGLWVVGGLALLVVIAQLTKIETAIIRAIGWREVALLIGAFLVWTMSPFPIP